MAFRGTIRGAKLHGDPTSVHRDLHVYDEGMVIGPPVAISRGVVAVLALATVILPLVTCIVGETIIAGLGGVGGMLMFLAGWIAIVGYLLWVRRRSVGPQPALTAPHMLAAATPGSWFVPRGEIVGVQPGFTALLGGPRYQMDVLNLRLASGVDLALSGPPGTAAYLGSIAIPPNAALSAGARAVLQPARRPAAAPSHPVTAMPRILSGNYQVLGERIEPFPSGVPTGAQDTQRHRPGV